MIEGHIEDVSADGVVHGWLRDSEALRPCHIQMIHGGRVLAEALAADFRPDLLHAGHGHGHYGFQARLREHIPPGRRNVALHLPHTKGSAPMAVDVPELNASRPRTVETLLQTQPGWTIADLLARPGCLDMDAHLAAFGAARFVDALFRFVLDRWPSVAEARLHTASLQSSRIAAQDLMVELLTSRERADMAPNLPSPYEPEFPFISLSAQ